MISAELFIQGWQSVETGGNYVGLAFNAKDASNYDFIYVRLVLLTISCSNFNGHLSDSGHFRIIA